MATVDATATAQDLIARAQHLLDCELQQQSESPKRPFNRVECLAAPT